MIGESGKLYLAAILDLFSRFIVGWAVSAVNDRHLTIKALEMALKRRCPERGLLHHSDQGCTYASEDYQTMLEARGIVCSMSRRGNCYDNAVMESFFSTVKSELGEHFDSHGHAKMECSTTSRCSTTSGVGTRRSAKSARRRTSGTRRARSRTSPSSTGGYSSLLRRENVVPGASDDVAVSAIAVPTCRCAPWDPLDDRHRPVVRSACFTVGALGGILTHALGARAIAAERLQGVQPPTEIRKRRHADGRMGQRDRHN